MHLYTNNLWGNNDFDDVVIAITINDIALVGFMCSKYNFAIAILGFVVGIEF